MPQKTVTLEQSKVTKNTVRFDEPGGERNTICPDIYLQKDHLTHPYPDKIEVVITWQNTHSFNR